MLVVWSIKSNLERGSYIMTVEIAECKHLAYGYWKKIRRKINDNQKKGGIGIPFGSIWNRLLVLLRNSFFSSESSENILEASSFKRLGIRDGVGGHVVPCPWSRTRDSVRIKHMNFHEEI
uniref:Uncharacterized protein n=1 Tax=Solanum lycopersicum TaxID=4081 RepID=A0A3Q7HD14_SOLLC